MKRVCCFAALMFVLCALVQSANGQVAAQGAANDAATSASNAKTSEANASASSSSAGASAKSAGDSAASADKSATAAAGSADSAKASAATATSDSDKIDTALKNAALSGGQEHANRAKKRPLGDYIPCLLDQLQDGEFRALPPSESVNVPKSSPTLDEDLLVQQGKLLVLIEGIPDLQQKFVDDLKAVNDLKLKLSTDQLTTVVKQLETNDSLAAKQKTEVEALLTVLQPAANKQDTFDRPADVSCSFTILQYNTSRDRFGPRVASQFVPIQVNIRNLNSKNEFLVHDVQIAVDTGLTPWEFGRFQASQEKDLLRSVIQRDQTDGARARVLLALQTAGAILTPINTAVAATIGGKNSDAASNLGVAVSVIQGPFLAGASSFLTDHTVDYLNNLNDMAFSASSTSKTVVPTKGSVPIMTFLAEKPLEQLPFAQCGHHLDDDDKGATPLETNEATNWHVEACQLHPGYSTKHYTKGMDDIDLDATLTGKFSEGLHFKKWSPAALNILSHRVFVVISGVHIADVSDAPAVSKLNCPQLADGTMDLSSLDANGNVSCNALGSNLDSVTSAKLTKDAKTNITLTWTPAEDGNSAAATLKPADAIGATGNYELMGETSSSSSVDLGQSVNFLVHIPAITSVTYSQKILDSTADLTVTIEGTNLDRMADIALIDKGAAVSIPGKVTDPASPATVLAATKSITLTFAKADLAKFTNKANGPVTLQYDTLDATKTKLQAKNDPGLPLTAPAAAPPAVAKPAAGVKKPVTVKN